MSTGHDEIATSYTLDGHQRIPEVLLINADLWDSLSPEDQELISEVAQESVQVQRDLWSKEVEEAMAAVEEAGNEVVEVDVASFQDAVAEMVDGFRDQDGDALDAIDVARPNGSE